MVLPAAGYGLRAQALGSKEILPLWQGRPLIDFHLENALQFGMDVHLITRESKKDLIFHVEDFCKKAGLSSQIQLIETTGEWPLSVLKSQDFWRQRNILCLPDTVFSPNFLLQQILEMLSDNLKLVVGSFVPEIEKDRKFSQWGWMRSHESGLNHQERLEIWEKPFLKSGFKREAYVAWGVIGFQADVGETLFSALEESTQKKQKTFVMASSRILNLQSFSDLTRSRVSY